jgi:predicted transcriptional regulator
MEKRDDLRLSTVAGVIESLGGTLHIAATFPDTDPIMLVGGAAWKSSEGKVYPARVETNQDQLLLPDILGPEQPPASRDVVFSIRPTHAEKILAGRKTVELRRRFADSIKPGTLALIYTTSPTRALTGFARIRAVERLTLNDLWNVHREAACLDRSDFEAYFSGVDRGYAIMLASAKPLRQPVGLSELRERFGFEPPQSYQYATPQMCGLVENA